MKFGPLPVAEAEGALLGHSRTVGTRRMKKGHKLTAVDLAQLKAFGIETIVAARLDESEVPEDRAASIVAAAVAGDGIDVQAAFTGRCNLYATTAGLALVDAARVDQLNEVDEALTVATVAPYAQVEPRQMLATIKIIPFAADAAHVETCRRIAAEPVPLVRVAPFKPHRAGLVMSRLASTKDAVLKKTEIAVRDRLEALGSVLAGSRVCAHNEASVRTAAAELLAEGLSPILVFGASAIVDRRDVVPAGIVLAGGVVDHFGIPVDPGNLLLLAHHGAVPIIGLPGCARSPKLNGFDWVLQRLLADLPVSRADLVRLGAGGLLKEIPSRPQPRAGDVPTANVAPRAPRVAALVLAGGRSRRMGSNKLLQEIDGKPMLTRVVDSILQASPRPVVVVTGHQAEAVHAALAGKPVTFAHNPDYAEGLSTSLRTGLNALPAEIDGAFVCLGDMPLLDASYLERLIAAFNPVEGRAICVPTAGGKRGNPVLWAARFFPEMKQVAGDVGARHLIGEHADEVCEVAIDEDGVLLDIDTPEAMAAYRAGKG